MKKYLPYLFTLILLFFTLGMVNILFAWLGVICMLLPFILLFKTNKKRYCQTYCSRAHLYTVCGNFKKSSRKTPRSFIDSDIKWIVLSYFFISILMIFISTINVIQGGTPMLYLRYLIVFDIPFDLPQLINIDAPVWMLHFGYRMYSMMLTTSTIGLILGLIYKPRTWCTICPINTLSDEYLKTINPKKNK